MRHFIFSFIIFIGLVPNTYSQEKKLTLRTGAGYYLDTFGLVGGQVFWLEGGVKLNTGFFVNSRVSMANISWEMSQGAFTGYRTIALRQMGDLTFSRPFKLSGQHFLEPGVGFKLKREFHLYPDAQYIYNSGTYILSTTYSDVFYDIGFTAYLDYHYQLPSGFYMGLRTDINIIWALGFEGLTISPLFGFRF